VPHRKASIFKVQSPTLCTIESIAHNIHMDMLYSLFVLGAV